MATRVEELRGPARAARARQSHGDVLGRALGVLVFLAGLGVIFTVLWLAFELFRDPNMGISGLGGPAAASPTAAGIGIGFGLLIARIALLFVGSVSGSLVANKGIRLYFAALPGRRDTAPDPDDV